MTIMFNGKFVSKKNAKISMLSDSFLHGYGVFETLRTYGGIVIEGPAHIDRLFLSAKIIGLKIKYKKSEIISMISKVVSKSPAKNQLIKVVAVMEGLIVFSNTLVINPSIYKTGVACLCVECGRILPEVKSISYLGSHVSHFGAVKQGYYDAILTDKKEEVFEGSYANVFWFEGDILCTRKDEVLHGITAEMVIKLSPFKVKFKNINKRDLVKKSEVFLTQTTRGVIPVTKIDKTKIGGGKIGKKTKKLMEIYVACVHPGMR